MSRGTSAGVDRADLAEAFGGVGLEAGVNGLPQRDFGGVVRATPNAIVEVNSG